MKAAVASTSGEYDGAQQASEEFHAFTPFFATW